MYENNIPMYENKVQNVCKDLACLCSKIFWRRLHSVDILQYVSTKVTIIIYRMEGVLCLCTQLVDGIFSSVFR